VICVTYGPIDITAVTHYVFIFVLVFHRILDLNIGPDFYPALSFGYSATGLYQKKQRCSNYINDGGSSITTTRY